MSALEISLAALRLDRAAPPLVAGEVWFTLDGVDFPAAHWSDSPLSVLGSLAEAVRHAAAGRAADVYFFDGPYYLRLAPGPGGTIRAAGVCDREGWVSGSGEGTVQAECTTTAAELTELYGQALIAVERWARDAGAPQLLDGFPRPGDRPGS
ncbi:hypothetical protein GCM10010441_18330 [Kitasatospora paracochleata]|uniref:Uncharacterized protein n=1 Tax=Kitasatospora paracochleata TaxID=58354 RepID=A0ABT1J3L4_9ACTN|nr:hypothetical protein [Kitasatospora paracochleata]MCP2312025.1 hypothetical protein [Kitasatospora paracochleata]